MSEVESRREYGFLSNLIIIMVSLKQIPSNCKNNPQLLEVARELRYTSCYMVLHIMKGNKGNE